jgi:AbrB family looped-hinge helix DNA binding protein
MQAASRLTRKYQATVPRQIREHLNLAAGDYIVFEVRADHVHVRKADPMDVEYLCGVQASLSEWASAEDEEAYRDL